MKDTRVFDCYGDAEAWNDEVLLDRDVYFSPDWLRLHCPQGNSTRGLLFRYREGGSSWWYPFLMRPLPPEYGVCGCDIESAYGYGGPSTNDRNPVFLRKAVQAFDEWCRSMDIVAEFSTFHPLFGNHELMKGRMQVLEDRVTVSMDLESEPRSAYSSQARYMCRRAIRGGVEIERGDPRHDIGTFGIFYNEAMAQMNAAEFYRFDNGYFTKLGQLIENSGMLLFAKKDGQIVAAGVFLQAESMLHYHLSANNFAIKAPGAMNLLLDKAAELGREKNLKRMHLGGGRTSASDDSLLTFKKTMGGCEHHFYIGKKVHDPVKYEALVTKWSARFQDRVASSGKRLLCYRDRG